MGSGIPAYRPQHTPSYTALRSKAVQDRHRDWLGEHDSWLPLCVVTWREAADVQIASQRSPDRRDKIITGLDLENVANGARRQSSFQHCAFGVDRDEHNSRRRVPAEDHLGGGDPVDIRHPDVGDDHIRHEAVMGVDKRASIANASDHIEFRFEQRTPRLQCPRVVVSEQNCSLHRVMVTAAVVE